MNVPEAISMAKRAMSEHSLDAQGWTFGFNHAKRQLGVCRYASKRIELSLHFVKANGRDAVLDTILHEIAHALAGPSAGHGPAWKAACLRVGAKPERLDRESTMPTGKWRATCPGCQYVYHRHRRPTSGSSYHCRTCGAERGSLIFQQHPR